MCGLQLLMLFTFDYWIILAIVLARGFFMNQCLNSSYKALNMRAVISVEPERREREIQRTGSMGDLYRSVFEFLIFLIAFWLPTDWIRYWIMGFCAASTFFAGVISATYKRRDFEFPASFGYETGTSYESGSESALSPIEEADESRESSTILSTSQSQLVSDAAEPKEIRRSDTSSSSLYEDSIVMVDPETKSLICYCCGCRCCLCSPKRRRLVEMCTYLGKARIFFTTAVIAWPYAHYFLMQLLNVRAPP